MIHHRPLPRQVNTCAAASIAPHAARDQKCYCQEPFEEAAALLLHLLLTPRTVYDLVSRRKLFEVADRKSTRLNSSHSQISYAVFCLKKKNINSPSLLHA